MKPGEDDIGTIDLDSDKSKFYQELLAERIDFELQFAEMIENIPGFIYTFKRSPEGHFSFPYASAAIQKIYGIRPDEILSSASPFGEMIHPDDRYSILRALNKSTRNLEPFYSEFRVLHPEKGTLWIEARSKPFSKPDGTIYWYGVQFDITDRKQMQSALELREQEFCSLAENSPDPIYRYDREGCRLYVNAMVTKLSRKPAEQLIGKSLLDDSILPPDQRQRLMDAIRHSFDSGEKGQIDLGFITRSGDNRDYQMRLVPECNSLGQVASVLAIVRDMTEIMQTQRQMADFVANLPGFAFTFHMSNDGHGSFPFASPGIEEIYGLKPEDVKDDMAPLHKLAHPEDAPRIIEVLAESARTMTPVSMDYRICRPGLPEHWVGFRSCPVRQADGSFVWHGIMLDMNHRKQVENALIKREREFRGLAENLPHNIVRYNRDAVAVYVNPVVERTLGDHAVKMIGMTPREYHTDGAFEDYAQLLDAVLASGQTGEIEKILPGPDGKKRIHKIQVVPEFSENGEVVGALMIGYDITDQRRSEDVLKFIAKAQWLKSGEGFLSSLAQYLGDMLAVDYVIIDKLAADQTYAETVAIYAKGEIIPDIIYRLEHTPCENVMSGILCCYPANVQREFPRDSLLAAMQVDSYAGIPLYDTKGEVIGLIAVMDGKAMGDTKMVTSILQLVETSAAAELLRRQMEDKLRTSEREFRTLVENTNDVIVRYNRQCHRIYVNPAWETANGIPVADVIGKSPQELSVRIKPIAADFEQMLRGVIDTGKRDRIDLNWHDEAGGWVYFELNAIPEFDNQGNVVSVLTVARDITERKQAEQYEQLRSQTLELLAGGAALPNILECIVRGVEQLNPEIICSIMMLESQGKCLVNCVAPSLPDFYKAAIDSLEIGVGVGSCGTAAFTGERVIVDDIQTHPYWACARELAAKAGLGACWSQPILSSSGQVLGTFAIYHREIYSPSESDISLIEKTAKMVSIAIERKQAEHTQQEHLEQITSLNRHLEASQVQLKDALQFTEGVINALPDFMFEMDREGRYLNVWIQNPDILAAQKSALLGKTVHEVFRSEYAVVVMEAIREADEHGVSYGNSIPIVQVNGETRWYEHSIAKKHGSAPSGATFIVLSRDTTERKQAEETLRRSREMLADAQKTAQLGSWDWDVVKNRVEWSEMAYEIYTPDKRPAEPSFEDFTSSLHPDDREMVVAAVHSAFEHDTPFDLDHRVVSRSNGVRFVHAKGKVFRGSNGKPIRMVGTVQDISEQKKNEEQLYNYAFFDQITSVPNRTFFIETLRKQISEAGRRQSIVGIMFLDIDHFKTVNDTYGHAVGDEMLKMIVSRIQNCIRSIDTLARISGDEFAILVPEVRKTRDLEKVASRILDSFKSAFIIDDFEIYTSVSIGIVRYPEDGEEVKELLKRADLAMYSAKDSGRNNYKFFSKKIRELAEHKSTIETELRKGLARDQFRVAFQPQVELASGNLVGAESLLRWENEKFPNIGPAQFIEIAEEAGLIGDIGNWVLEQSCRMANNWNRSRKKAIRIAVNLSRQQFLSRNIVRSISSALDQTGCSPEWLELEITESLLLADDKKILTTLNKIRGMGITIAIDDFGVGYSALAYLKKFPIDVVKIDKLFIQDITENQRSIELVKGIVSMTRNLNLNTIVEGVETSEQAEILGRCDVSHVQGYFFGKPEFAPVFEKMFLGNSIFPLISATN